MRIIITRINSVRKIPTSNRSITGEMPTYDKGSQSFESTLERDLMYILNFDVLIDRYIAQPVKIKFSDENNISRSYTPDILIYYKKELGSPDIEKIILAEVKYKDDLCKNFREYLPKFRAAMRYAKKQGWAFRVYTEEYIRTPFLTNAKFLLPYSNMTFDPLLLESLLKRIEELRETDPQGLIASFFTDKWNQAKLLPAVWFLIAKRNIGTNLHERLTMNSRIWLMQHD